MQLDLDDEETPAPLNLLVETIEADRYPYSPRSSVHRLEDFCGSSRMRTR